MLLALTHDCNGSAPNTPAARGGIKSAFARAETVVCLRVGTTTHNTRHEITTHKMEVVRVYKGRLPGDKRSLYISTAGSSRMNQVNACKAPGAEARFQVRELYVLLLGVPVKSDLGERPKRSQGFPLYDINLVDIQIKILRVSRWETFFLGFLARQQESATSRTQLGGSREF